jgi:hypothetical protein
VLALAATDPSIVIESGLTLSPTKRQGSEFGIGVSQLEYAEHLHRRQQRRKQQTDTYIFPGSEKAFEDRP